MAEPTTRGKPPRAARAAAAGAASADRPVVSTVTVRWMSLTLAIRAATSRLTVARSLLADTVSRLIPFEVSVPVPATGPTSRA